MRSNHVGLKIVAVAAEDWDYEAKVEIFNINVCFFQRNSTRSVKTYLIPTAQKHLIWSIFVILLQVFFFFMILDVSSFGKIIRTHVLSRIGREWRHTKIHELMRMAEAMRREDKFGINRYLAFSCGLLHSICMLRDKMGKHHSLQKQAYTSTAPPETNVA